MRLKAIVVVVVLVATSLVIVSPPSEASSDGPPCTQSLGRGIPVPTPTPTPGSAPTPKTGPTPSSTPTPPRILWPCPGWDPTRHGVASTKDVTGDGVEEVAVGIDITYTGGGIIFLIDGATQRGLWYRRVGHTVFDLTYLADQSTVIAVSVSYEVRNDPKPVSDVYSLSVETGGVAWTTTIPEGIGPLHRVPEYGFSGLTTIDDIDGDGGRDILVGTQDGVVALSGTDGSGIWVGSWTQGYGPGPVRIVRAVNDIDGDGVKDVVGSRGVGGEAWCAFALSGATGTRIWSALRWTTCVADAADLDGDGIEEVVAAARGTPGVVYILDGGTGAVKMSADIPTSFLFLPYAVIGSTDLNGDGIGDVVVAGGDADPGTWPHGCWNNTAPCPGKVVAFSGADLSVIWTDPSPEVFPYSMAQLSDASGVSFVVGTEMRPFRGPPEVYRLNANGQRLWTYKIWDGVITRSKQGIGILSVPMGKMSYIVELRLGPDIDRNGVPDILAVSANLRVYAVSDSGELLWKFLP